MALIEFIELLIPLGSRRSDANASKTGRGGRPRDGPPEGDPVGGGIGPRAAPTAGWGGVVVAGTSAVRAGGAAGVGGRRASVWGVMAGGGRGSS